MTLLSGPHVGSLDKIASNLLIEPLCDMPPRIRTCKGRFCRSIGVGSQPVSLNPDPGVPE